MIFNLLGGYFVGDPVANLVTKTAYKELSYKC